VLILNVFECYNGLIILNEGLLGITIKIVMELLLAMFRGSNGLNCFGRVSKNLDEIKNGSVRDFHLYLVLNYEAKMRR
jgi:hypothetical protein